MTRAFVAVRPPDPVLDAVDAVAGTIDIGDGRRTSRPQWHVTVQFLGNGADVDAVAAALAGLNVRAGRVQLGGMGAFPNARRARVLWIGIARGAETFTALARAVGECLGAIGHEPEDRPYHAHLTLARFKNPADVRGVVDSRPDPVGPVWLLDEVTVYESRPQRNGALYLLRANVRLAAGE